MQMIGIRLDNRQGLYDFKAQLDSLAKPFYCAAAVGRIKDPVIFSRDAACFSLYSGKIIFFQPVRGQVTGALFRGRAAFELSPPTLLEKQQLKRFTGDTIRQCEVDELYFRFTDSTFEEIYDHVELMDDPDVRPGDRPPGKYAKRIEDELFYSMGSRLLMDLHNRTSEGLFYAALDPEGR